MLTLLVMPKQASILQFVAQQSHNRKTKEYEVTLIKLQEK